MTIKQNVEICVAIVDDHKQMREMIRSVLQQLGFKVIISAPDGKTLIEQLNSVEKLPNVCLLDYNMPKMKGYQVAGIIRRQFPEIKIAALTANLETECLVKMVQNGATSYLIKSGDPLEWKEAIISLVNRGHFVSEWMATSLLEYIRLQ
jgi:DNA-binding NarL/FixJ family response regulator